MTLLQSSPGEKTSITRERLMGNLELPSAGYTFAVSHPAVATVLTGTTDPVHLGQNAMAATAPVLTPQEIDRLRALLQAPLGSH